MTLNDYITKVRRLLRDQTSSLYAQAELIAYINEARHTRDLDTRRVRTCYGVTLTTNKSTYSLTTDIATATVVRGITTQIPKDCIGINPIPNGVVGGIGLRYPLSRMPYSRLSWLLSTSWPGYPVVYGVYDPDTIVIGPPPAQGYASEWDCVGIFPDLVNLTDVEPMPDPYNDPLPYLAASIAKENAQRYDEAEAFQTQYKTVMMRVREGVRQLAVVAPWADLPRGMR